MNGWEFEAQRLRQGLSKLGGNIQNLVETCRTSPINTLEGAHRPGRPLHPLENVFPRLIVKTLQVDSIPEFGAVLLEPRTVFRGLIRGRSPNSYEIVSRAEPVPYEFGD